MKLAEALANRADLQRRIEQMRGRLQKSALVGINVCVAGAQASLLVP